MARLEVGPIDDQLLEWFAHKAQRMGQTEAEYARALIEREARSEQTWQTLEDNSSRMRERMKGMARYAKPKPIRKVSDQ